MKKVNNKIAIESDNELFLLDKDICFKRILNMTDTLDILSGKWKIPIIILLTFGSKRYSEISKELKKITDRTLSKELKELEANLLVTKKKIDSFPQGVEYSITEHGLSLTKVLFELRRWGQLHREKIHAK